MREIKFRAWDKKKNKMWSVHTWSNPTLVTIEWTEENSEKPNKSPQTETNNWKNDYVLMQFTGLKDKNGKEIYEGDVVHTSYGNEEIRFEDGAFRGFRNTTDHTGGLIAGKLPVEVIGNIYENPELLK